MPFDQKKFDNGKYTPDSLYGRLGELKEEHKKLMAELEPLLNTKKIKKQEMLDRGLRIFYVQNSLLSKIIAGVEASRSNAPLVYTTKFLEGWQKACDKILEGKP